MVRTFWMTNNAGGRYDLLSDKAFLYAPEGLGFTKAYEAISFGTSEVVTQEQLNLGDISGEILFSGSTIADIYNEYDNFTSFLRETPIVLHYMPPNLSESFGASVVITNLDKTEVKADDGFMHCPISMHMTTHWIADTTVEIVIDASQFHGKAYELAYPYGYGEVDIEHITLINRGTEDIGLEIELSGDDIVGLTYTLEDINGKVYGRGQWNGAFSYFYMNSSYEDENVLLKDDNDSEIVNPLNYQGTVLATTDDTKLNVTYNFIRLKAGQSTLKFNFSETFTGTAKVRFSPRYASI